MSLEYAFMYILSAFLAFGFNFEKRYNIGIARINPEIWAFTSRTWSSSNTDVATVDQWGRVMAIGYGTAIITVTFHDEFDYYVGTLTSTVTVRATPIITSGALPSSRQWGTYDYTLSATGGAPINWRLATSSQPLPEGLSLSSGGVISGMPTRAGTFNFTVEARNNLGTHTRNFSITISEEDRPLPPTISYAHVDRVVTISTDEPGAIIRYTTDGREPTINDPGGTPQVTFSKTSPMMIRAVAFRGGLRSPTVIESFPFPVLLHLGAVNQTIGRYPYTNPSGGIRTSPFLHPSGVASNYHIDL